MKQISLIVILSVISGSFFFSCSNEVAGEYETGYLSEISVRDVPADAIDITTVTVLEGGQNYVISSDYTGNLPDSNATPNDVAVVYLTATWTIDDNLNLPPYVTIFVEEGGKIVNPSYTVTTSIFNNIVVSSEGEIDFSGLGILNYSRSGDDVFTNYGTVKFFGLSMRTSSFINNAGATAIVDSYGFPLRPGITLNYGTFLIDGVVQPMGQLPK